MKRAGVGIMLLAAILILAACAPQGSSAAAGPLTVSGAWARAAVMMSGGEGMGGNGAAYMVIENSGSSADRLIKAESDVAEVVEIHKTEMKNDIMSMAPVDAVEIPANGQAELAPGGYHIMFLSLKRSLNAGDQINLKLTFEQAGTLDVVVEVRNP